MWMGAPHFSCGNWGWWQGATNRNKNHDKLWSKSLSSSVNTHKVSALVVSLQVEEKCQLLPPFWKECWCLQGGHRVFGPKLTQVWLSHTAGQLCCLVCSCCLCHLIPCSQCQASSVTLLMYSLMPRSLSSPTSATSRGKMSGEKQASLSPGENKMHMRGAKLQGVGIKISPVLWMCLSTVDIFQVTVMPFCPIQWSPITLVLCL